MRPNIRSKQALIKHSVRQRQAQGQGKHEVKASKMPSIRSEQAFIKHCVRQKRAQGQGKHEGVFLGKGRVAVPNPPGRLNRRKAND
eukprot:1157596-Pelagomonas_calceolata.AAC.8